MDIYDDLYGFNTFESADMTCQAQLTKLYLGNFKSAALTRTDHSLLAGRMTMSSKHMTILHIIQNGFRTPLCADQGFPLPDCGRQSAWRHYSPTPAGYVNGVLSEMMHKDGIDVCNQRLVVHSLVHLFKACQKLSLKLDWPDMNWIIARQGNKACGLLESANMGDPLETRASSGTMETSAKIFGISLGVKLSKYATQRREGK